MHRSFQHIRDHVAAHTALRQRLDQVAHEQAQLAEIRAHLPDGLDAHCLDLTLSNGRLTLFLDSTAWLTRARFLLGEILTSLKSYHVTAVGFQVKLPERDPTAPVKPQRRVQLSTTAAKHLLEAAEQQSDPQLRATLQRLARLGKPAATDVAE